MAAKIKQEGKEDVELVEEATDEELEAAEEAGETIEEVLEITDEALLAKAAEVVNSSIVIVEDTKTNRAEYNTKDLSYRAIELLLVVLDCLSIVIKVANRQIITDEIDDKK